MGNIKKIPYGSHEEWLAIRKQYIGGSDAGAILGLNPYASPYSVWAEKTGKVEEFEGNTITKTGAYLEEFVAKMFEDETGKKVRRCNFTLVNDEYPWACANVDRMIEGEDAILECKTTNSKVNLAKFRQGDYPEQWYCQMMHYLAVTGKSKAYLAVLSECRDFHIFELERDEDEIKDLMESEQSFWNCVTNLKPPYQDGSEATTNTIKTIYGSMKDNGETADLSIFEDMLDERARLDESIKTLKERKDEIDNQLKATLGECSYGYTNKYSISYKSQSKTTYDVKAYMKANPTAPSFGPYTKITGSRVFRVNKSTKKEKENE